MRNTPASDDETRLLAASRRLNRAYAAYALTMVAVSGYLIASAMGTFGLISAVGIAMAQGVPVDLSGDLGSMVTNPASDGATLMRAMKTFALSGLFVLTLMATALLLAALIWTFRHQPRPKGPLPEAMDAAVRPLLDPDMARLKILASDLTAVTRRAVHLKGDAVLLARAVQRDGPDSPQAPRLGFVMAHEAAHHRAGDDRLFTMGGPLALAAAAAPAGIVFLGAFLGASFVLPDLGIRSTTTPGLIAHFAFAFAIAFAVFRMLTLDRVGFVHVKEWFADRIAHTRIGQHPYAPEGARDGLLDLWRATPSGAERIQGTADGTPRAILFVQAVVLKWLLLRLIGALVIRSSDVGPVLYLLLLDAAMLLCLWYAWPALRVAWPRREATLAEGLTAPLVLTLGALTPYGAVMVFMTRLSWELQGVYPFYAIALTLVVVFPIAPLMCLGAILRLTPAVAMRGGIWPAFLVARDKPPRPAAARLRDGLDVLGKWLSAILAGIAIYVASPGLMLLILRLGGRFDEQFRQIELMLGHIPLWILLIDPAMIVAGFLLAVTAGMNVFQTRRWSLVGEAVLLTALVALFGFGCGLVAHVFAQAPPGTVPQPAPLVAAFMEPPPAAYWLALKVTCVVMLPLAFLYWARWNRTSGEVLP